MWLLVAQSRAQHKSSRAGFIAEPFLCPPSTLWNALFTIQTAIFPLIHSFNCALKVQVNANTDCLGCRSEGRVGWRKAETHLFPVVDDDDLAVLVVDGHRALVAFTCKTHVAGRAWKEAHGRNKTWQHAVKSETSAREMLLTWSGYPKDTRCELRLQDGNTRHLFFGVFFLTYLLLTYSKRNTEPTLALPARPVNTSSYLGAIKGLFFKCVSIGIDFKCSVCWIHSILKYESVWRGIMWTCDPGANLIS